MNSGRRHGFWRLRPLAGFAAAFCLLAAVWLAFGWLPAVVLYLICGPCAVLVRQRSLRFACMGVVCAMIWVALWWAVVLGPIAHLDGRGGIYTVELTDYAQGKTSYGLAQGTMDYGGRSYGVRVYLTDGSPDLGPGDVLRLEGSLTCTGTGERYNAPEGIWLTLSQTGSCIVTKGEPHTLRQKLNHWNTALANRIDRLLTGSKAGLLQALLTGDRSGIPAKNTAELSRSGLSHIAAVSGLHLTVLAGLLVKSLGQKTGGMLAIPLLVMFTAFTGFSPSALRALTLWCFLFAAWSLRRRSDSMTALLAALLLQTAANPCALMSVSLQLSFGAVCGLVLLGPACNDLLPPRKRWSAGSFWSNLLRIPLSGLLTSFSATVFVLPLLLYYFGSFSVLAPVTNLLTLWAVSPAMVLGGIALALTWLSGAAARLLAIPVGLLLDWILLVAERVAELTHAALSGELILTWLAAGALLLLGVLAVSGGAFRLPQAKVAAAVTASLLLLGGWQTGNTDLLILNCRSGYLTLTAVTDQGSTVLDPGPYAGGRLGEALAEDLWSRGVASPDYVVATGTHVSRAGALADLCSLTEPAVIAAPQEAYLLFDRDPANRYLLPDSMEIPGGTLSLLPCGRTDRNAWLLEMGELRVLSACGVQPRPFLALNAEADLACDILLLDEAFLKTTAALEQLLAWCDPGQVILAADAYTDPAVLRDRWTGDLLVLEDRQQHIYTLWRD